MIVELRERCHLLLADWRLCWDPWGVRHSFLAAITIGYLRLSMYIGLLNHTWSELYEKSTPSLFRALYRLGIRLNCESPLNSPSAQDLRRDRNFSCTLGWVRPNNRRNSVSNSRDATSSLNSLPQLFTQASRTCNHKNYKYVFCKSSIIIHH